MRNFFGFTVLVSVMFMGIGCGVKSKPLPPLKEPWISTGDIEKDKEKKNKQKRPQAPADSRAEFAPKATPENTKERPNEN